MWKKQDRNQEKKKSALTGGDVNRRADDGPDGVACGTAVPRLVDIPPELIWPEGKEQERAVGSGMPQSGHVEGLLAVFAEPAHRRRRFPGCPTRQAAPGRVGEQQPWRELAAQSWSLHVQGPRTNLPAETAANCEKNKQKKNGKKQRRTPIKSVIRDDTRNRGCTPLVTKGSMVALTAAHVANITVTSMVRVPTHRVTNFR